MNRHRLVLPSTPSEINLIDSGHVMPRTCSFVFALKAVCSKIVRDRG